MLHSAMHSTFIKLPRVVKIFILSILEWPFYTGLLYNKSNINLTVSSALTVCLTTAFFGFAVCAINFYRMSTVSLHGGSHGN